jgi:hypothetical protein
MRRLDTPVSVGCQEGQAVEVTALDLLREVPCLLVTALIFGVVIFL